MPTGDDQALVLNHKNIRRMRENEAALFDLDLSADLKVASYDLLLQRTDQHTDQICECAEVLEDMLKAVDFKKTGKKYTFAWKKKAERKIPKMELDFKAVREKPEVNLHEAQTTRAKKESIAKEILAKAKADNDKYLERGQKLKSEVSKF